ncbi:hypothetical protein GUJ93_ZPchr0001g32724 [Zizania palustris]|nr:hypothetical protein GUJ93_ZPchr0001g32724 [Zizania palustris]
MANVQYTENMTEEQVDAMAGSETLRLQASLFGSTRNYKVLNKTTNKLRDSLLPKDETKLAIPLLLLICQHRSKIIINADATYIKMVSEHFDRCHGILLQYVEFLSSAVAPTSYVQLIPPLEDLIHKYHIEPDVAFLIYRPVMRLFKSTTGGDTCWPLDDNEEGESVSCDDLILHLDTPHKSIMWSGLLSTVRTTLPSKAWNGLSPDLYATFWGLTLYDLHFPKDRYDAEIKKLHENLKQLEDNSDNSSIAISRLNHIDVFLCKTLQPMICCCTEYEAGRLGRFLHETLKMAYYWKSDESVYERECGNKPGFAVYFRDPNSQRVSYCQFVRVHWKWSSRITKISSIFPVIRKSGVNIEKRVAKLRGDEREDLKVLATGVAAALAARKSSWLSEEVFGMGYLDLKQRLTKTVPGNQSTDSLMAKDQSVRAKSIEGRHERLEGVMKLDAQQKKNALSATGFDSQLPSASAQGKVPGAPRGSDEPPKLLSDEGVKVLKPTAESETRAPQKRVAHSAGKVSKHDVVKEDTKSGKSTSRVVNHQGSSVPVDKEVLSQAADGMQDTTPNSLAASNGNLHTAPLKQKRSAPADEQERGSKRKKGEIEGQDGDLTEHHTDKAKKLDSRDPREKADRTERRRGEDMVERSTDRAPERREYSIERIQERGTDRAPDKGREDRNKEERNKVKHAEPSIDRTHPSDERFRGQSLPPPPPLPTSFVPRLVGANRRDEDTDRRGGSARHNQRSSPRHDDKERYHLEENAVLLQDDEKHRREEDLRDRKRDDRDVSSNKVDDRDRDKGNIMEDSDPNIASKRRKLKREQSALEAGEYAPSAPQLSSHGISSSQIFEIRERERKGAISQHRASHADDLPRMHGKDSTSKTNRREADQVHDREWEEEKRPRAETKRKHRK